MRRWSSKRQADVIRRGHREEDGLYLSSL